MVAELDFAGIPERVQRNRGFRINYINVRTNGDVAVYVEHDDIEDAGWTYVLNRANGWQIIREVSHSP